MYFTSLHNQKKDNNQFKKQKQPELPESQTVWKSDNQGIKEETFIQTGRRGGDGQPRQRGYAARWWLVDQAVPYLHADKPGGATGEQDRQHNPSFQHREIKPQNLWVKKTVGVMAEEETPSLT